VSEKQTELHDVLELPEISAENFQSAKLMRRGRSRLIAVALLILLGGVGGAVWLVARLANNPATLSAAATNFNSASTTPNLDLSYPGATKPDFDAKELWPNGLPEYAKNTIIGLLVTKDDYRKVIDYYKQKLPSLGYPLNGHEGAITCHEEDCLHSATIYVSNGTMSISLAAMGNDDLPQINNLPASWQKLVPPGQTLIGYQINPIVPTLTVNSAALTAIPAPTLPIPATPVSAGAVAYFGPDNRFHTGTGQVMTTPSTKQPLNGNTTFQIDWLLSDVTGTTVQITTEISGNTNNKSAYTGGSDKIGSLTDDSGHTYDFIHGDWYGSSDSTKMYQKVIWHTTTLPTTVRNLIFTAGPGLAIKPTPVTLPIASFAEAKLPQVKANPNAFRDVQGVKVSVPYTYFGPDRTVLLLNFSNSGGNGYLMQGLGRFSYGTNLNDSLSVLDDKNLVVNELPATGVQPPTGSMPAPPLNIAANGDMTLILEPLKPGTKSLHLKLSQLDVTLTPAYTSKMPSFDVPLVELLKTGASQSGPTVEVQGIKFQVVSEQVTLDATKKKVDLMLKIAPKSGSIIKLMSLDCPDCGAAGISGSNPTPDGQPIEFHLNLNYDPTKTTITARIDKLEFGLAGPWQLDLPVS